MYKHFKSAVDHSDEQDRRRVVNIYAGVFTIASLIALVFVARPFGATP
jgi:hypothetical protein